MLLYCGWTCSDCCGIFVLSCVGCVVLEICVCLRDVLVVLFQVICVSVLHILVYYLCFYFCLHLVNLLVEVFYCICVFFFCPVENYVDECGKL